MLVEERPLDVASAIRETIARAG
ncbi:protein of unknown function [Pseudorhizobium banfieldiae]|uniref:Uncharacterized protein n=1 Tax=Pseudorhizobium banfieldiae TaxID=1125847 RepID=L0NGY9_9HYPH|nr:protein of unknown function [Pseudorhizobium banfieldiae]